MATPATLAGRRKTRVFICYSRKDGGFAVRLVTAVQLRGFEACLDKTDILPGNPGRSGWARFRCADAVAFVMTPNSVASQICSWEIGETERLQKKLLPVAHLALPQGPGAGAAVAAQRHLCVARG